MKSFTSEVRRSLLGGAPGRSLGAAVGRGPLAPACAAGAAPEQRGHERLPGGVESGREGGHALGGAGAAAADDAVGQGRGGLEAGLPAQAGGLLLGARDDGGVRRAAEGDADYAVAVVAGLPPAGSQ